MTGKNVFDGVHEDTLMDLLEQAHVTGGTLPPALQSKLEELSGIDEDEEFKSLAGILRQAHEGIPTS